jgi:hypothetical protein
MPCGNGFYVGGVMYYNGRMSKWQSGVSVVEALVGIFVLATLTVSIAGLATLSTRTASVSEQRTVALALANERAEEIRLMHYNDVGYTDAAACEAGDDKCEPDGLILREEGVLRNYNQLYRLQVYVELIDDPQNGTESSPLQEDRADYKQVVVQVATPSGAVFSAGTQENAVAVNSQIGFVVVPDGSACETSADCGVGEACCDGFCRPVCEDENCGGDAVCIDECDCQPPTPTPTVDPSVTPTPSPTLTPTPTGFIEPSDTVSPTPTPSSTLSPSYTTEPSSSVSPTATVTPTPTPTPTPTSSDGATPSVSLIIVSPTPTPTPNESVSPSATPQPTPTPESTPEPTPTDGDDEDVGQCPPGQAMHPDGSCGCPEGTEDCGGFCYGGSACMPETTMCLGGLKVTLSPEQGSNQSCGVGTECQYSITIEPNSPECSAEPDPSPEPQPAFCGDGVRDPDEDCDGNNAACANGLVCNENCACVDFCGNGVATGGEACDGDDDNNCTDTDVCNDQCQCEPAPAVCGDGILNEGEQCDGAAGGCGEGSVCNNETCQCELAPTLEPSLEPTPEPSIDPTVRPWT